MVNKSSKEQYISPEGEETMLKEDHKDDDAVKEKKEKEEENLMDAQTIFKYNIIKRRHKDVKIITELYSHQNLAYLDDPNIYHVMNEYGYDQTPIFAAGEVYSSGLMDSLVCQACYNPELITVLRQLVIGETRKSFHKKNMIIYGKEFTKIKTSNLYHVKVPNSLVGSNFSRLYKEFALEKQMIPLGLYRQDIITKDKKKTKSKINFVVTNPPPDTPLKETDYVFVFAHEDPEDVKITENDEMDTIEEKNSPKKDQTNIQTPSVNVNMNEQRKVDFFTKKIKIEFQESLNSLTETISRISTDIGKHTSIIYHLITYIYS
jgi:hypothetical protein